MTPLPFFTRLEHERLLAVRGPDAKKFLQGQVTCNLDYLEEGDTSLGARCTPKGRMLSSFRILKDGDGYVMAMASELLSIQLADLKKYAVFSKVTVTDETDLWSRFGMVVEAGHLPLSGFPTRAGATQHTDAGIQLCVDASRFEYWLRTGQGQDLIDGMRSTLGEGSLGDWLLAQVRAGEGQVFKETSDQLIPQMINLQAVGGVSFKKGCYTGQEIVARMQYLGRLKRRLYRASLAEASLPPPGTPLFSPVHGSSVGEVVIAAPTAKGCELLAVLQDDAATDGRIRVSTPEGSALKLLALPYTLDRDREIQR